MREGKRWRDEERERECKTMYVLVVITIVTPSETFVTKSINFI